MGISSSGSNDRSIVSQNETPPLVLFFLVSMHCYIAESPIRKRFALVCNCTNVICCVPVPIIDSLAQKDLPMLQCMRQTKLLVFLGASSWNILYHE